MRQKRSPSAVVVDPCLGYDDWSSRQWQPLWLTEGTDHGPSVERRQRTLAGLADSTGVAWYRARECREEGAGLL